MSRRSSIADRVHRHVHGALIFDRRRDRLARALNNQLPLHVTVLDVGCGSGAIGADLAAQGRTVSGVDTLRRDQCAIEMTEYDGSTLPFDDGSFDWATIVDVLHHAADPARVLSEAKRVTTAGVVLKDHYCENVRQRVTLSAMDWVGNRQFGVGRDGRYLSRDEWSALFDRVGLEVVERDEALDLYPAPARPIFESDLHFVARLEPVG